MADREYKRDEKGRFATVDSRGAKEQSKGSTTARQKLLEVLKTRKEAQKKRTHKSTQEKAKDKLLQAINRQKKRIDLSKTEWRLLQKRLVEIRQGAPYHTTADGNNITTIENNNVFTIVVYSGDITGFTVLRTVKVREKNAENIDSFIDILKELH